MSDKIGKPEVKFEDLPPEEKAKVCFMKAARLHKEDKLEEAVSLYGRAVAFDPVMADSYNNMAVALRKLTHFDAALACYQRSISIRDDHAGTYSNMGNVLNDLDRVEDSICAQSKAIDLDPNNLLYIYNKALVLRDAGRSMEAITLFDEVLAKDPEYKDCVWDRALTHLMAGDFKKGFAEYDARWSLAKSPPRSFEQPQWAGDPLGTRRLFIHREQGFGDALQFVRLVSQVKKNYGGTLILECQPELLSLFEDMEGIDEFVPFGNPLPDFDVWIPLMSLAHILKVDEDNIPGVVPYLSAKKTTRFRLRPAPQGGLNIGVVWAGSPTHQNDRRRSVELGRFLSMMGHKGVTLFSLQKGPARKEIKAQGAQGMIVDVGQQLQNFSDTAAIIDQLDLVISVDTSVVHLAGSMGKPVWLLLPFTPDWRWMHDRDDSPWYPTMQIYRQAEAGNWAEVFEKVYEALAQKLS